MLYEDYDYVLDDDMMDDDEYIQTMSYRRYPRSYYRGFRGYPYYRDFYRQRRYPRYSRYNRYPGWRFGRRSFELSPYWFF